MAVERALVLVVDDNRMNRQMLARLLEIEGYDVALAIDGREAVDRMRQRDAQPVDVVLLDILMPELDGYEVLQILKADETIRHVPVIMISALDEVQSVIRCIEAGAADYLSKPFNSALLRARVAASLAAKRLRDTELEYLQQVSRITEAAEALEHNAFEPDRLDPVARRDDALGHLARVFRGMAAEVHAREARLQRQVAALRFEIDETRKDEQVGQITGSEYFQGLRSQAASLRDLLSRSGDPRRDLP